MKRENISKVSRKLMRIFDWGYVHSTYIVELKIWSNFVAIYWRNGLEVYGRQLIHLTKLVPMRKTLVNPILLHTCSKYCNRSYSIQLKWAHARAR